MPLQKHVGTVACAVCNVCVTARLSLRYLISAITTPGLLIPGRCPVSRYTFRVP